MTCIAYRDGLIAADTGATVGDSRCGHIVKVVRGPDGQLCGAAGDATFAEEFRKWVLEGQAGDAPKAQVNKEANTLDRGVIFHRDGRIEVHEPSGVFFITAPYFAFGSGRPEALGAMFAGADAEQAVRAAMEHDTNCFGDVTVLGHDA